MEHDFEFSILETSLNADGLIAVKKQKDSCDVISSLLPVGPPPVLKSIEDEVKESLTKYLEDQSIYSSKPPIRSWSRAVNHAALYSMELSELNSSIQVERNQTNGALLGFFEAEEIRDGDNVVTERKRFVSRAGNTTSDVDRFFDEKFVEPDLFKNLLDTPPGFQRGIEFHSNKDPVSSPASFNITDLMLDPVFNNPVADDSTQNEEEINDSAVEEMNDLNLNVDFDPSKTFTSGPPKPTTNESSLLKNQTEKKTKEVWAMELNVNVPVQDFHKKIPNMAHEYPFKLDTFQQLAVLRLEKNHSVFVAAHTSAGKTVVAEYAIALTAKHMTRVIYTSPIKALSNQKFRDFKQTFTDVGLITGDVQINPEAFCLIMTTEILRSMLYNGSDVIRDLEWVIFDEVHYINDAERGVVWEEVLIMLPRHCNVILLSATVPNAFEFANWIGRTRQAKIHVITTLKRPVPLEHYLYTGNSSKTSKELFLIVDGDRKFLKSGYKAACDAKNERMSKHAKSFGAKHRSTGGASADKNVWLSLVTKLKKDNQLPIVAFTLSRRRCDDNAKSLESLDLTSKPEKREIEVFFMKCILKLKGSDKDLPQVVQMKSLLVRGLGVHHSGILPILKEVVEMLFSRGLVKLLFATETFAMGVNMPARTVVFDSIRKHDGTQMRNLLPGEYVQMAGRAGRRGLDATGTVIILCKGDVPEMSELHTMMLGKVTQLQSQFRLTYGMILNLLRVEQLRVEEVMKKSFSEFNSRKNSKAQEEEMTELKSKLDENTDAEMLLAASDYEQYYLSCKDLIKSRNHVISEVVSDNPGSKVICPGRVVVLSTSEYRGHVAAVLKANLSQAEKTIVVLVLVGGANSKKDSQVPENWSKDYMLRKKLFKPHGKPGHIMIEIKCSDIFFITAEALRVNSDNIIADCKRRQLPRFSKEHPSQATAVATQQLLSLVDSNPGGLTELDLGVVGIRQLDLVEEITKIRSLESSINECFECVLRPRFDSEILIVSEYMRLKEKYLKLKYLLSDESLFLLPEYQQRVKVLESLRYIDGSGAVQMKGRVACEVSNHELILTELVFENVFAALEPSEIVALLSCCVFQQRVEMEEVSLTPRLKEGMNRIIEVARMIGAMQIECGMREAVEDYVEILKFGLVEVVYEWAKGTSFKDITNLTSVQEGAIVRNIQRLNELCKDVRNAARVIGDPSLYSKMEKCSELVKRDIVFAASLYTQ